MIQTVLGPIAVDALGATSMHEHVLADASALHRSGLEALDPYASVTAELAGALRWSQLAVIDNLVLDDPDVAAQELSHAVASGQAALVDLTSLGLGPDHGRLPAVARAAGIHIVVGYGAYLETGLPPWYLALDETEREQLFVQALDDAVPGASFRAGLLGIMGTTAEFPQAVDERTSLRAAARAAVATGASVAVRLDPGSRHGQAVLELVGSVGLPADRVIFSNVDEYLDLPYLLELAVAGAVLEMCFGGEGGHLPRVRNSHDAERLDALVAILDRAPDARLVLGTSLWTKAQYRRFGGPGYDHLLARVVPTLRASGVTDAQITRMLITEPARLLDRTDHPQNHPEETP